jgi:hypothetical protein
MSLSREWSSAPSYSVAPVIWLIIIMPVIRQYCVEKPDAALSSPAVITGCITSGLTALTNFALL